MFPFSTILQRLSCMFTASPRQSSSKVVSVDLPSRAPRSETSAVMQKQMESEQLQNEASRQNHSSKRKSSMDHSTTTRKRTCFSHDPNLSKKDSGVDGGPKHGKSHPVLSQQEIDRALMPPPATPRNLLRRSASVTSDDETDSNHITTSPNLQRNIATDEYDMEQARRFAAAVTLPENSGIWTRAEQELFYHLALRGFEPLLPHNWMIDFPTLPLSLYADENGKSAPLITTVMGSEFRAIRALRDLLEMGKNIRDQKLASPGFQIERIIRSGITKHILWALTDIGVGSEIRSRHLPVHTVVTLRKGQTTSDAIEQLSTDLHNLAAEHRSQQGIHASIETPESSENEHNETQVIDEDDSLPILTGLLIISSVVAVFTFNAHQASFHSPPPNTDPPPVPNSTRSQVSQSQPLPNPQATNTIPSHSSLRFISTFDFSNAAQDVWNAIAIAIISMHIRQTMKISINHLQNLGLTTPPPEISPSGSSESHTRPASSPPHSPLRHTSFLHNSNAQIEQEKNYTENHNIEIVDPDI